MKGSKFAVMGLAVLVAAALWSVPVWADKDDPWAPDVDGKQLMQSGKTLVVPAPTAEEDTGDPWFGETQENAQMPVTTIELNPIRPAEEDTGDPWFSDTQENIQASMQLGTMTQ